MDNIEEKTYSIIGSVLKRDPKSLHPEDRLELLVTDSIQFFELISAFKKTFNRNISYTDIVHIETIADIIKALRSAQS